MLTLHSVADVQRVNDYFQVITNDDKAINIYFLTDEIFRIRASFDKKFDEESYILTKTAWEDRLDDFLGRERQKTRLVEADFRETGKYFKFQTSSATLLLVKEPLHFILQDKEGNIVYQDLLGRAFQKDHLGRVYHYNQINAADNFYGFGEKTGEINKMGRYMRFSPKDNIGYDPELSDPMYKHIPFYIKLNPKNKKSLGIFYHNTYESALSMGGEISGYFPRYTYFVSDGGDIDFFLIHGSIREIVQRYTDITGKTVMQPKYSLGYIGSTMYYSELEENCDKEILNFVDECTRQNIPIDSFMLSSGYLTDEKTKKKFSFLWNHKRFPDPGKFFDEMRLRGVEVSPNVKPGVLQAHDKYREWEDQAAYIKDSSGTHTAQISWWGGVGAYFDYTSPKSRKLWKSLLKKNLISEGVTSIWNDNCEYDGLDDRTAKYDFDGGEGTHGQLKCIQSTLMAKLSHDALNEFDATIRPYVICRSGSAGIQRYAQVWAGDNPTSFAALKYNIPTLLGLGLSGVANAGSDNGGFQGPAPSAELLVRWVQNGIFQPRFSIHSCNTDNTVTEPWMYREYTQYIRNAIHLRYQLVPYLYSLLRNASRCGDPIMRPIFYDFQHDEKTYNESFDFMFGPFILVANVVEEGAKTREVYLPKGSNWYGYFDKKKYAGGQRISIDVDISTIPMFIGSGAIIPTTTGLMSINREKITYVEYIIAPEQGTEFIMYEDDGKTQGYLNGEYLETKIQVIASDKVQIRFEESGNFDSEIEAVVLCVIQKERAAYWVTMDGSEIPQFLHRHRWEGAELGFYYSHSQKSVLVKYPNPKKDYEVVISFEQFDLIGMEVEF